MTGRGEPSGVRLSELLGVLSFGADLGMGQPMEHVLRQCMLSLGLADQLALSIADREAVHLAALVAWVGCHVDSYEAAKWFGDETALRGDFRTVDFTKASAERTFMLRHVGSGLPAHRRLALMPSFLLSGRRDARAMLANHFRAADDLMDRLGMDQLVRDTVEQCFERWDGRGVMRGLRGQEILVTARLVNLADAVEVFHRAGGVEAAVHVARERAGTQFDPELVELFAGAAEQLFAEVEEVSVWDAVVSGDAASRRRLEGPELETALEAVADFCDIKSPYTLGHSRGVAAMVDAASASFGLTGEDATLARQAALVHDLGNLGVPNSIWDKKGQLSPAEQERVRMHAYLTERMLTSSSSLEPLAEIAAQHHERLDGSGYPLHLSGSAISPGGRLLAAADSYHARLEPRPHRPARPPEQAAEEVRAEVRAGRLDGDAVASVLAAAGHRTAKRREWPAGLTAREVEILRLLARGLSNKQIAKQLSISPKTASSHIEHIYTKLGVSNRALASLFAAKHGLVTVTGEESAQIG